jgi:hypothetical protein
MKSISDSSATEIRNSLVEEAAKKSKDISWFTYAKKLDSNAWEFLPHKEIQMELLKQLAKKISQRYPKLGSGQVADTIANIVNSK